MSASEMEEALQLDSESELDSSIVQIFSRSDYQSLRLAMSRWHSVPYLASHALIIDQALEAHINGSYGLSIVALLPFIEGIAAELIEPETQGKKEPIVKKVVNRHASIEDVWSKVLADIVCHGVYQSYAFGKDGSPLFNRHGILHGRVADYNTAANSLRTFLLVEAMAGIYILTKAQSLVVPRESSKTEAI